METPLPERRMYRKRADALVVAVQLDLDTDGFSYRKWGGIQRCKPGDWLVRNGDDTYTVDRKSFAETYRKVSPGVFEKTAYVWAEVACCAGAVDTKEGASSYERGDYIVSNQEDGSDRYAVDKRAFERMYEPVNQFER